VPQRNQDAIGPAGRTKPLRKLYGERGAYANRLFAACGLALAAIHRLLLALLQQKKPSGPLQKTERPNRFSGRVYFDSLQQDDFAAFFALVVLEQQSLGGVQQSSPVEQQSLGVGVVLVEPWQHQLSGQQSRLSEQQSKFLCAASPATYKAPVITIAIKAFVNMENLQRIIRLCQEYSIDGLGRDCRASNRRA
jgi:hypothetical protein